MPRPSKAAGSVALVTGANRGIGLAFVRELTARGAKKVYAGVRDPDGLTDEFAGLPVEVVPLDVTDPAAVGAAADACPDVSLLVNNAGLFTNTRLVLTSDPDAARREMEVNYFGVLNMTRAFAPVTSATEPAALLGRGIATSATSGHQARHYGYESDDARCWSGNQGPFGGQ